MHQSKRNDSPICSSTPKYLHNVQSRKGIHDNSPPSPLQKHNNEEHNIDDDDDDEHIDDDDEQSDVPPFDELSGSPKHVRKNRSSRSPKSQSVSSNQKTNFSSSSNISNDDAFETNTTHYHHTYIIVVVVMLSVVSLAFFTPNESQNVSSQKSLTFADIQSKFVSQSDDFWLSLKTSITDVKYFNRPSTIIFLHKSSDKATVLSLLNNISKYASCLLLDNCTSLPIILEGGEFRDKGWDDSGYFIEEYREELNRRAVMVLKNLDRTPGIVAEALHFMCDEYSPLVKRSLYLFTVESDGFDPNHSEYINLENLLMERWRLKKSIFYPLYVRISSTIVRVLPENDGH